MTSTIQVIGDPAGIQQMTSTFGLVWRSDSAAGVAFMNVVADSLVKTAMGFNSVP